MHDNRNSNDVKIAELLGLTPRNNLILVLFCFVALIGSGEYVAVTGK